MFKVYIDHVAYAQRVEITFVEEGINGKRVIAKPVKLEFEEYGEGARIEPTLTLHSSVATGLLQAFAEALDEQGIKTDKDAKIEGKLIATSYHLEDLRKLLKLNK